MNKKQRERWSKARAKGRARFLLLNTVAAALCGAAGYALVWLATYAWRGEPPPRPFGGPGVLIAIAAASALAGYFQASGAWRRNERGYLAPAEAGGEEPAATRPGAI